MWKDLWRLAGAGSSPPQSARAIARLMHLVFAQVLVEVSGDEVVVSMVQHGCLSIANHTKEVFEDILNFLSKEANEVAQGSDKGITLVMASICHETTIDMRAEPYTEILNTQDGISKFKAKLDMS